MNYAAKTASKLSKVLNRVFSRIKISPIRERLTPEILMSHHSIKNNNYKMFSIFVALVYNFLVIQATLSCQFLPPEVIEHKLPLLQGDAKLTFQPPIMARESTNNWPCDPGWCQFPLYFISISDATLQILSKLYKQELLGGDRINIFKTSCSIHCHHIDPG